MSVRLRLASRSSDSLPSDSKFGNERTSVLKVARFFDTRGATLILQFIVIAVFLVCWQLLGGKVLPIDVTSKPLLVWHQFAAYVTSSAGWADIRITVEELIIGYALGISAGIFVGLLLGSVGILGRVFQPIIAAFNAIPTIALAPLFLIMTGLSIWSKVSVAGLIVFFLMFNNTYTGRHGVSDQLLNMVRVIGGSKVAEIRYVVFPTLVPNILAGMRAGVAFAMIGVVVGEFIASANGIGNYINNQSQLFNTAGTMAGILVLVIVVLIGTGFVSLLQRYLLRWRSH